MVVRQKPGIEGLKDAVINNDIYQSSNLVELIGGFIPNLDKERLEIFFKDAGMKSYILVPLMSKNVHFGSLIVFSSKYRNAPL